MLSEQFNAQLETPHWLGEDLFQLKDKPISKPGMPMLPTDVGKDWTGRMELPPFFHVPHRVLNPCLTRENVQRVFVWRSKYDVKPKPCEISDVAVHVRQGDFYTSPGFPVVPMSIIEDAVERAGFNPQTATWVIESKPHKSSLIGPHWLYDFKLLEWAENVFVYPRSTFSQMAALLGNGNIYMPYNYELKASAVQFKSVNPDEPVVFPTKNNNLP